MDFSKLSEDETRQLDALQGWRRTLARAELMATLAKLRLEFSEQAQEQISCDPWFRDQAESVRVAILGSIAATRAEELARLAEAQVWLRDAPARIDLGTRAFPGGKVETEASHG